MAWQEAADDLRMKSIRSRIEELRRLEDVFDQTNPGESQKWNETFVKLCISTDKAEKASLLRILIESEYYKVVGRDLLKASRELEGLIELKKTKFAPD